MRCPRCGSEENGAFCSKCGLDLRGVYPQQMQVGNTPMQNPQKKKGNGCFIAVIVALCIVVAIIAGFTMLGVLIGSDERSSSGAQKINSETEDSSNSQIKEDNSNDITVGSTFTVDDLQITVNDANTNFTDYDDEYGMYTPEDGMKYIMVSFTFENIGDSDDEYVSIYDFDCYADNTNCEQEYLPDGSDFMNTNLSSGRNVSFKTYYEVPADAESIELEYTENMWTDEKIVIRIQ